ncbi:MAG TPA: hypothetical protein VF503_28060 [Sphingobium sp.]|uniref:hypothetical protein n=1 Tax=Sphingobium sp. TaxID=1912891 RepID=UPI002ED2198B
MPAMRRDSRMIDWLVLIGFPLLWARGALATPILNPALQSKPLSRIFRYRGLSLLLSLLAGGTLFLSCRASASPFGFLFILGSGLSAATFIAFVIETMRQRRP